MTSDRHSIDRATATELTAALGVASRRGLDRTGLWLLASTESEQRRRALQWVAAVVALLILGPTIWHEEWGTFAKITSALHGLTLLMVGSLLVRQRALKSRGGMHSDPRFLIGAAFVLIGAASALAASAIRHLGPVVRSFGGLIYDIKAWMMIVGCALMAIVFVDAPRRRAGWAGA